MKLFGITGASGSGKTTMVTALLPVLRAQGLRVSTIKHAHHGFDMDRPGKDSWQHREAGAEEVMVVSNDRWALLREARGENVTELEEIVARMSKVDLILVEGFRRANLRKLEVFRPSLGKPPFYPWDYSIAAVATDVLSVVNGRPRLDLSDIKAVAAFILAEAKA